MAVAGTQEFDHNAKETILVTMCVCVCRVHTFIYTEYVYVHTCYIHDSEIRENSVHGVSVDGQSLKKSGSSQSFCGEISYLKRVLTHLKIFINTHTHTLKFPCNEPFFGEVFKVFLGDAAFIRSRHTHVTYMHWNSVV